jgi:hypothetical protein
MAYSSRKNPPSYNGQQQNRNRKTKEDETDAFLRLVCKKDPS